MIRPVAKFVGALALVVIVAAGIIFALGWKLKKELNPDPVTVATASLQAVREQAVLVPFAARFVAVVTSEQHRFGFSAKKTMTVAQQLYEGVELGDDGAVGLITYMRTDSTRVSDDAIKEVDGLLKGKEDEILEVMDDGAERRLTTAPGDDHGWNWSPRRKRAGGPTSASAPNICRTPRRPTSRAGPRRKRTRPFVRRT